MKQNLSYAEYRIHIEKLTYLKKRLNETIVQKKLAHRKYRELANKQDILTNEIMEMIPG